MGWSRLRKVEKQIPRGLKPARDDKNKQLGRGPEGPHYQNCIHYRLLPQPVKACHPRLYIKGELF